MVKSILKSAAIVLCLICANAVLATETDPTGGALQVQDSGYECRCKDSIEECFDYIKEKTGWIPIGFNISYSKADCKIGLQRSDSYSTIYEGYCQYNGYPIRFSIPSDGSQTFDQFDSKELGECDSIKVIQVTS